MKKIFFAATMALALTCVSCYDDKGNYDYTDLEVVEVEKPGDNILEKYIISRFDTLTIDPKVTYQGKQVVGDEAAVEFLLVQGGLVDHHGDPLGEGQSLGGGYSH